MTSTAQQAQQAYEEALAKLPGLKAPPGQTNNLVNSYSRGWLIVFTSAITLAVTTLLVLIRTYTKRFLNKSGLQSEDCKWPCSRHRTGVYWLRHQDVSIAAWVSDPSETLFLQLLNVWIKVRLHRLHVCWRPGFQVWRICSSMECPGCQGYAVPAGTPAQSSFVSVVLVNPSYGYSLMSSRIYVNNSSPVSAPAPSIDPLHPPCHLCHYMYDKLLYHAKVKSVGSDDILTLGLCGHPICRFLCGRAFYFWHRSPSENWD